MSNGNLTPQSALAGLLMGCGLWLHLTERHEHDHRHAFSSMTTATCTTNITSIHMLKRQ